MSNVDSTGDNVNNTIHSQSEIESAIDEVLNEFGVGSPDFKRKFKHRLLLSLEGDVPESAVSDLIEHTPSLTDGD
jgi:hypothetical protein